MQDINSSASNHRIDIVNTDDSDYSDKVFAQNVYHCNVNIIIINIIITKVVNFRTPPNCTSTISLAIYLCDHVI